MNLLVAFVLFTFLAIVGIPQLVNNQFTINSDTKIVKQKVLIQSVETGSPAAQAGLVSNDTLISISPINGTPKQISDPGALPNLTQSLAGQTVNVTFINTSGQTETKTVTLRNASSVEASLKTNHPIGYLGIASKGSSTPFNMQRSTWSAPIVALGLMKQITVLTFQSLGHMISSLFRGHPSEATSQVAGPVGVVNILVKGSQLGFQFILFVIAVISLSLAIINVLPIPALDGGRLFFTLIPRLFRGRPLKPRTEEWIHGGGLAVLMLIFVLITIVDIKRII